MTKNSFLKFITFFIIAAFCAVLLVCAFNVLVDPFGAFGDPLTGWYSYDMVSNPRIAKISWLESHRGEYDSFIVGGSKSSSLPIEELERLFPGSKFYNTFGYGGEYRDYEQMVAYLIREHSPKRIILHQSGQEMYRYGRPSDAPEQIAHPYLTGESVPLFYLRYMTLDLHYALDKIRAAVTYVDDPLKNSHFIPETGVYDKSARDLEDRTDEQAYIVAHPDFLSYAPKEEFVAAELNLESVERIAEMCRDAGVELTVMLGVTSKQEFDGFPPLHYALYLKKLSLITDYWDFSGPNALYADARNFYDIYHYTNDTGYLILSRMFGEDEGLPEDFGFLVTRENANDYLAAKYPGSETEQYIADLDSGALPLPILLYHDVVPDGADTNPMQVTVSRFHADMEALIDLGCTTISLAELADYAAGRGTLPDRPVLLTFDDGYLSNYAHAFPILEELNMKAAIFVVGWSVGQDTMPDGFTPIIPHFGWAQAREMVSSGLIEIGSHSHDMHWDGSDGSRRGALPLEGESAEDYAAAFSLDLDISMKAIEAGAPVLAYAYPYGLIPPAAEPLLRAAGIEITLSTRPGINMLYPGRSYYELRRITVDMDTDLLAVLAT